MRHVRLFSLMLLVALMSSGCREGPTAVADSEAVAIVNITTAAGTSIGRAFVLRIGLNCPVQGRREVLSADVPVTWSSSNPLVATVSAVGEVIGLSRGVAVITAKPLDTKSRAATVTVDVDDTPCSGPAPVPQCRDGIDNDGDGKVDYPSDPGCTSPDDNDEYNPPTFVPQCSDGFDNPDPEDLLADANDPGCHTDGNAGNPASYDPQDNDETNSPPSPAPQCSDGFDNPDPEDLLADANDPGCHTDGNAGNPASYDPQDNDETNSPPSNNGSISGPNLLYSGDCTNLGPRTGQLTYKVNGVVTQASSWTSSNTSVLTINASGAVTAVAPGTVTITAVGGGTSATMTIEVRACPAVSQACQVTDINYTSSSFSVVVNQSRTVSVDPVSNWDNAKCAIIWYARDRNLIRIRGTDLITVDGIEFGSGLTAQIWGSNPGSTDVIAQVVSKDADGKWRRLNVTDTHLWTVTQ